MPKFYYKARDRKGALITGTFEAPNAWLARKAIGKQNLTVLELSGFNLKLALESLNEKIEVMTQGVTPEEQLVLMSQLETGFSVGIPIIQMLNFLQQDLKNPFLKQTLKQISEDVSEGSSLHAAFAKHGTIFDSTIVGLIKTGEVSGRLDETLNRITKMIEQKAENRSKVKSAIFYPKIVIFVMGIVTFVLVTFVIPKLKEFLASFGADLPPITRFVVGTSDFFIHYWYMLLIAGIGLRYSFKRLLAIHANKVRFDEFKLNLPAFGKIFLYLELNNFCVILELLINSGIPIMEALETLKESQNNEVFKNALSHCQEEISKGGQMTKGFDENPVFPSTFKNMMAMGEESGRLPQVLNKLGRYYQVEIDYRLNNLSKLIEPILLVIIFAMVLVIALAVFLPIWKMSAVQRPH